MHKPSVALLLLVMLLTACAAAPSSTATPAGAANGLATATATPRSVASPLQTAAASTPTPIVTRITPMPSTVALTPTAIAVTAPPVMTSPMAGFPLAQVVTTKDMVNVRAMPSTTAAVVTLLAANTEVDLTDTGVMSTEGGPQWLRVSYNGQTGYVRSDLVGAPHAKATSTVTSTAVPSVVPSNAPTTTVPTRSSPPTATVGSTAMPVSIAEWNTRTGEEHLNFVRYSMREMRGCHITPEQVNAGIEAAYRNAPALQDPPALILATLAAQNGYMASGQ